MKITTLLSITLIGIIRVTAQSAGDYRSIASGNWNEPTKWQVYNGTSWVSTNVYPGQNSNAGGVTISIATQITITASVPNSVSSLIINTDFDRVQSSGRLVFGSVNAVSLNVAGNVLVYGSMIVADQSGAKSHSLTIQGGLVLGAWTSSVDTTCVDISWCPLIYNYFYPDIQTNSNDDKLAVVFNTTIPNSSISGVGGIVFQDVTFNGVGISIQAPIYINGSASFINGIVRSGNFCNPGCAYDASGGGCIPSNCGTVFFNRGSTVSGASVNSFVDGRVWKQGDEPFTFPIGSGAVYSPLTMSAPVGSGETFSARYVRAQDLSTWGVSDPGLYAVSDCEYWELNPGGTYLDYQNSNNAQTSYPLNVTVGWSPSSSCGSFYVTNVASMTLAHFNGTGWDTHGGSATGMTSSGTITRTGVNYFGPFTLGNMNANCVTVSGLNVANITTNSATLSWSALPGAVSYDVNYKAAYTNHWTTVTTAAPSTSVNVSDLSPVYTYDWKVRANCSSSSSAYRLGAQFTTQSPCSTPSGLSATNVTSSSATLNWSAVTTAVNYSVQYKPSTATTWTDAIIGTSSLSCNLTGLAPLTSYDWRVAALCIYDQASQTYYGSYAAQASFITTAFTACSDVYEPNNTSAQAKTISFGTTVSGGISSSTDIDWFKLTLPNAMTLQITLSNLPVDYDLYLYNKNFVLIGSSTNTGTSNDVVVYNSRTRNATLYIKIVGKNGVYSGSQCYSLLAQTAAGARFVNRAVAERGNEIAETSHDQLLYPNPASNVIYLHFTSAMEGIVDVQIMNNVGQLKKQYPVHVVNGNNEVRIPVIDIIPGMYILKLSTGESRIMRKFLIAR